MIQSTPQKCFSPIIFLIFNDKGSLSSHLFRVTWNDVAAVELRSRSYQVSHVNCNFSKAMMDWVERSIVMLT